MTNFSLNVFNDSEVSCVNATAHLKVELLKSMTSFVLSGKTKEDMTGYDHVFAKGIVDTCKVSQGIFSNLIVQLLAGSISQYSNFKFECPHKSGHYYVNSFPFDTLDKFPSYIIGRNRKWQVIATIKGKVLNIKSLVQVLTLKFQGELLV